MASIAIMMNDGSTELPRPWNRASSQDELIEMVAHFIGYHTGKTESQAVDMIDTSRIDLDAPIARVMELMNEHKLTREQILQAAGLTRIETPKATVTNKVKTAKPKRITKQSILIDMLQIGSGASIEELTKATGWQPHTVRGAISNVLRKKLGLNVVNEQSFSGKQVYRIYDEA